MALLPVLAAVGVMLVVPGFLSHYWVTVVTSAAVYSIAALGLSLLVGRVGIVSLAQFALVAVGAWTAMRLGQSVSWPFLVVVLVAGVLTGLVGTVVGLPALRLSGLYLALITLMEAASVAIVLTVTKFPNGGAGLLGYDFTRSATVPLRRPVVATTDTAYLRYVILCAAGLFLLAYVHVRSRPGRAWAAIRDDHLIATATGINVTRYRVWALGLSSFITGVGGGLLAASPGGPTIYQFPPQESIALLAGVLIGGVTSLWGAVIAGLGVKVVPALLNELGLSGDAALIVFGAGLLHTLWVVPEGVAGQLGGLGRGVRALIAALTGLLARDQK